MIVSTSDMDSTTNTLFQRDEEDDEEEGEEKEGSMLG